MSRRNPTRPHYRDRRDRRAAREAKRWTVPA